MRLFIKTTIPLLIIVLFTTCNKYQDETIIWNAGPQTFGWATGEINGLDWEASGAWINYTNDNIKYNLFFTTYTAAGPSERFHIRGLKWSDGEGRYDIEEGDIDDGIITAIYSLYQEDGHVILGRYSLNTKKNSWVEITKVDQEAGIIEGRFELHFENTEELEGLPEKVSIKQGRFEVEEYQ